MSAKVSVFAKERSGLDARNSLHREALVLQSLGNTISGRTEFRRQRSQHACDHNPLMRSAERPFDALTTSADLPVTSHETTTSGSSKKTDKKKRQRLAREQNDAAVEKEHLRHVTKTYTSLMRTAHRASQIFRIDFYGSFKGFYGLPPRGQRISTESRWQVPQNGQTVQVLGEEYRSAFEPSAPQSIAGVEIKTSTPSYKCCMKPEIPGYTTFEEIGDLLTLQTSDGVTVFSERQLGYREALPVPLDAPVEAVPDCQLQGQRKVDFVGSEPTSSSHHQSVGEMITSAMYTFSALEFRKGQQNYVLPRTTASSSNVGFAKEPIPESRPTAAQGVFYAAFQNGTRFASGYERGCSC